ncbi:MAG: 30S ribosomal protein S8, partial [Clostridia bacterium]|nr:30S ribosomal protein S8 [Clostridia bacterium]
KVRGGMGNAILTTPNGIMSDRKARAANVSGEILLYVW